MSNVVKLKQSQLTIDDLIRAIHAKFGAAIDSENKGHRCRVQAGQMLIALRKRIEAGEEGEDVQWWEWYESKFVRSRRDAEKVMALARSPDPEAAAQEERAATNERMKRQRSSEQPGEENLSPATAHVRRSNEEKTQPTAGPLQAYLDDLDENHPYSEPRFMETVVDYAFRLVMEEMNQDQQQRFVAKLKEHFEW